MHGTQWAWQDTNLIINTWQFGWKYLGPPCLLLQCQWLGFFITLESFKYNSVIFRILGFRILPWLGGEVFFHFATCYSVDHWSDQNIYWSIALQAWTTSISLYLAEEGGILINKYLKTGSIMSNYIYYYYNFIPNLSHDFSVFICSNIGIFSLMMI